MGTHGSFWWTWKGVLLVMASELFWIEINKREGLLPYRVAGLNQYVHMAENWQRVWSSVAEARLRNYTKNSWEWEVTWADRWQGLGSGCDGSVGGGLLAPGGVCDSRCHYLMWSTFYFLWNVLSFDSELCLSLIHIQTRDHANVALFYEYASVFFFIQKKRLKSRSQTEQT